MQELKLQRGAYNTSWAYNTYYTVVLHHSRVADPFLVPTISGIGDSMLTPSLSKAMAMLMMPTLSGKTMTPSGKESVTPAQKK